MAHAYSAALWVAAHTAALAVIVGGASTPKLRIRDASDVLLAEIILDDATSAVNGTSGDITLEVDTQEDAAPASGTASYCEILDGDGDVHLTLDCQAGSTPVSGACVLNTLSIVEDAPVNVLSIVIEAGATIA